MTTPQQRKTKPCPGPDKCTHTDPEHRAFDDGVKQGKARADMGDCPYHTWELREAWLSRHSVGVLNRKHLRS